MIEHLYVTLHGINAVVGLLGFAALVFSSAAQAMESISRRRYLWAVVWIFTCGGWLLELWEAGVPLL